MSNLDARALIPLDYKQMDTDDLEQLKRSIMRSMQHAEAGVQLWHREHQAIRIELASRSLNERQALPVNADALEPEYVAWQVDGGETS